VLARKVSPNIGKRLLDEAIPKPHIPAGRPPNCKTIWLIATLIMIPVNWKWNMTGLVDAEQSMTGEPD
jgi:hypothetical protein